MPKRDFAPPDVRPDFASNSDLPRHRWYRFKEGFSAELVRHFVEEHMPTDKPGRLLDPFLGSGTTAVEGALLGHDVLGVETNPFMAFLARVKTRDYAGINNIDTEALKCLEGKRADKQFQLVKGSTLVEADGLDKWLFNRQVGDRFAQIRTAVSKIKSPGARDLILLALLAGMEQVSNARKDGKCWRYKRDWQSLAYDQSALDDAFAGHVLRFMEDIKICPTLKGSASVFRGDSRKFPAHFNDQYSFDGVLTSPPYLNSFDYTDIYRPEMLLMQQARNSEELRRYRFDTMRSHVQVAWKASAALDVPLLQEKVAAVREHGLWSSKIPDMINAYFVDLDRVVHQCSRRLKAGSTAAFVVADSAYNGVVIPVSQILEHILERRKFRLNRVTLFRRTKGNGHHQLRSGDALKEIMVSAVYSPT